MKTTLCFSKGESSECEVLGTVTVNNVPYAVFCDINNKDIYIYRYSIKRNKYKLEQIKDKEEFRSVCREIDRIVNQPRTPGAAS